MAEPPQFSSRPSVVAWAAVNEAAAQLASTTSDATAMARKFQNVTVDPRNRMAPRA